MAFGFPAHHTEAYVPDDTSRDLRPLIEKALAALFWPILQNQETAILAWTNMNLRSWGEKITITFCVDGSLTVESKCGVFTKCFDWGKNKGNVRMLLDELRKQIGREAGRTPAVTTPLR